MQHRERKTRGLVESNSRQERGATLEVAPRIDAVESAENREQSLEAVSKDLDRERQLEKALEIKEEQDREYEANQEKILPRKEFYDNFLNGKYTKEIDIDTPRRNWRFWKGQKESILDVSAPEEYQKEGVPPLVLVGGLGSNLATYLDDIYEAVTAGRRVFFMNPSRTFQAREEDKQRIDFLEEESGGRMPDALVRKASVGMQILEKLDVDEFDMIGHSQGGIVSAGMLFLAGDRVRVWNPVSPAGLAGKDNFLPLAARYGHERAHRMMSEQFPTLYRGLGIIAEKLGVLKMLYGNEKVPFGPESLEARMARPRPNNGNGEELEERGGNADRPEKPHQRFKPHRAAGFVLAAKRISETHMSEILDYLDKNEALRTRIMIQVAHGEAVFPEHRIISATEKLNVSQYTVLDRHDDHIFHDIAMRIAVGFLESEDQLDGLNRKNGAESNGNLSPIDQG